MRKAVKIGFIGVFCAVIGLAFPVFNIFSKQLSMDSHENRLMTGLLQVLQSPLRELPRNLDNFLVDNSPFRYQFVLVNAGLDYALFGTSQSDQVLPGKDGWLFYKDGPNAAQPLQAEKQLTERSNAHSSATIFFISFLLLSCVSKCRIAYDFRAIPPKKAKSGIFLLILLYHTRSAV